MGPEDHVGSDVDRNPNPGAFNSASHPDALLWFLGGQAVVPWLGAVMSLHCARRPWISAMRASGETPTSTGRVETLMPSDHISMWAPVRLPWKIGRAHV